MGFIVLNELLMGISEKSIKLLWSNSAGRCSFDGCDTILTGLSDEPYVLGEMAHIKGNKSGSNRYDFNQSEKDRDAYNNLILLCPTHHSLIDKKENEKKFTVEVLLEMKLKHEQFVKQRFKDFIISDLSELKQKINEHLMDNYQVWYNYGPISEKAKKSPNSKEIYEMWVQARAEVIVPNNREVIKLIENNRNLFNKSDQCLISEFIVHAKSYEKWVNNEISYEPVIPFPQSFKYMIESK